MSAAYPAGPTTAPGYLGPMPAFPMVTSTMPPAYGPGASYSTIDPVVSTTAPASMANHPQHIMGPMGDPSAFYLMASSPAPPLYAYPPSGAGGPHGGAGGDSSATGAGGEAGEAGGAAGTSAAAAGSAGSGAAHSYAPAFPTTGAYSYAMPFGVPSLPPTSTYYSYPPEVYSVGGPPPPPAKRAAPKKKICCCC
ncbi:unnamed protein product [Vitrella brassicaformis CCMP3155]|uniref:Uncharacterized protein n=1 Tax=Vitrella brassicaformis (strain CCMP3155) TaxID=1169540 RepID=A0A0G4ED31_VITBC|nr:unnamed protein product [Vitrella brassicaformis CCMP3155]|eukprot:CEL93252.1 unnamed protein product [Vitrella brassicaformis CCMP3155]